ncbi:MAG: class I SAM-dependent methyltransferase [Candidatus Moranbacteria bacterium]|nr:class I SAM-dependent methyltransferase [Candidatus Moranbacteria bacterium]
MKELFSMPEKNKESTITPDDFGRRYFVRETPEEYENAIEHAGFVEIKTPYAEDLLFELDRETYEGRDLLSEKIKGEVVLDLGCGDASLNYEYAEKLGAKLFIGIDFSPAIFLPSAVSEKEPLDLSLDYNQEPAVIGGGVSAEIAEKDHNESDPKPICKKKSVLLSGDMLRVISLLPDESVSVIISSGIEGNLVSENTNSEYLKFLASEIVRVLKKKGIFIRYMSDVCPGKDLKEVASIEAVDSGRSGIFEKTSEDQK